MPGGICSLETTSGAGKFTNGARKCHRTKTQRPVFLVIENRYGVLSRAVVRGTCIRSSGLNSFTTPILATLHLRENSTYK